MSKQQLKRKQEGAEDAGEAKDDGVVDAEFEEVEDDKKN